MITEFAGAAAITVICYLAAEFVKCMSVDNKWIPVICGLLGGVLGLLGWLFTAGSQAPDPISAMAGGVIAGLAATGSYEIYRHILSANNGKKSDG